MQKKHRINNVKIYLTLAYWLWIFPSSFRNRVPYAYQKRKAKHTAKKNK